MISYIFKSKPKNIIVTIFAAIYLLIQFNEVHSYWILYQNLGYVLPEFISLLPSLLIFIYMITLKREYKIKQLLFPLAFAILSFTTIFSIVDCFDGENFTSLNTIFITYLAVVKNIIVLTAYILSFVGSLFNFKNVVLLRAGMIICVVLVIVSTVKSNYIDTSINPFFGFISQDYYSNELFEKLIILFFYLSIFILTLNKKSEYIDITPFVEARRIKKEMKKAKKLARENNIEEFSPPLVADGYWCCMGCGKILPKSEIECECGYKR